ncbi:xylulokinase [uncultured Sulfitobacter sp.]|uniref:xylulokinase n=1 Tax=uncultured Sulfitobacter sp. TaxID=191468 RepID=UPI00261ED764|nr:xylulokinase [uncultured Sulfitobacter sp.]
MSFLGIDLGTSGVRVLLMDEDGAPVASAEASCGVSHPHPGWSEQDPADWIEALEKAVAEIRDAYPDFARVSGIGVAGHMHGATLLDSQDAVLRPCILWNDTRSHAWAARMNSDPAFREITGNVVFPGFTAPKLAWVRQHEPEIFARVARVLLPAAYLNHYLTGEHVSDLSDCSGTAWLDVAARDWSDPLLDRCGLRRAQMPRLVEGTARAGTLRPAVADRWGLGSQVCVAGGAGDNAAAACGMGALREGSGFVSLGTSGVILMARDRLCSAPDSALHSFCHAVPDTWYQMSVMLSAADSLTWLASVTGRSPAALTEALGDALRPPGDVGFAPYLSGERTPHNDSRIRAGFAGISTATTQVDLTHAVLEGVCFGLRDGYEAIRATGGRFETLYVIGGGSASRYWLQMLATVLDTPLHVPQGRAFGAALGAARLGQAAATGQPADRIMPAPATGDVITPDVALRDAYDAAYARFRRLYPAFSALSRNGG